MNLKGSAGKIKGVILAAGQGTRLRPLTHSIPKEMVPVCGKTLIQHAVETLKAGGLENIIVVVGNNKGTVIDHLKDGKWLGIDVSYRYQQELTGIASAIYESKPLIDCTFAVMFGDEIIEPKDHLVKNLIEKHRSKNSFCTVGLSAVEDPKRYGVVKIDDNGKIISMIEKPETEEELKTVETNGRYLGINGVFVFEPKIFDFIEKTSKGRNNEFQITDSIKLMLEAGLPCYAVVHEGIYRDVGTFDALLKTEKELLGDKT